MKQDGDNQTGKIINSCSLFDHDHAFAWYDNITSQTTECDMTLDEAAKLAQEELKMDMKALFEMECPQYLEQDQWERVFERAKNL